MYICAILISAGAYGSLFLLVPLLTVISHVSLHQHSIFQHSRENSTLPSLLLCMEYLQSVHDKILPWWLSVFLACVFSQLVYEASELHVHYIRRIPSLASDPYL